MKSVDEIRLLLVKFYDGATSQAEESELQDFFVNATEVPEDLIADRAVFLSLAEAETEVMDGIEIPDSLTEELSLLIDREEQKEVATSTSWWTWKRVTAVAASVCVVAALGIFLITGNVSSETGVEESGLKHAYVPQTEEGAIAETSRALMILSEKMTLANVRVATISAKPDNINEN